MFNTRWRPSYGNSGVLEKHERDAVRAPCSPLGISTTRSLKEARWEDNEAAE